jgi:hypothetical protein
VLDPCGSDLDAVAQTLPRLATCKVYCNDSDAALPAKTHVDATSALFWDSVGRPDWVVGSPPYHSASTIVQHALRVATVGVAFKLRLSFLEPCADRAQLLKQHSPTHMIVLPRVVYRKQSVGGSRDWMTEAWFIWCKDGVNLGVPSIGFVTRDEFDNLIELHENL